MAKGLADHRHAYSDQVAYCCLVLSGERWGQLYAASAAVKREILRGRLVHLRLLRILKNTFSLIGHAGVTPDTARRHLRATMPVPDPTRVEIANIACNCKKSDNLLKETQTNMEVCNG